MSLIASGALTHIADGRSTGLALASASYTVPVHRVRLEAGSTATILGTSDQRASSSWLGFGRAHVLGQGRGAWLGAGGGTVHLETENVGASTGEIGGWLRRGEQRLTLSGAMVRTSTVSTVIFSDETVLRVRDPVGYTDVSLAAHGVWRQLEGDVVAISRHAWKGNLASTPTAMLSGAWWFTPYVGVAGAVGRQLADPLRGTARARYATVALRLSAERHGPVRARTTPPRVAIGDASIVAAPADGGAAMIRVHAAGARTVEIMGDLTAWTPVALARRGDRWEVRLTTTPGAHHVVVRIDGGAWAAPANLPRIDDELGGTVGLLVVP